MRRFPNAAAVGTVSLSMFAIYGVVASIIRADFWPDLVFSCLCAFGIAIMGALVGAAFVKKGMHERLPFVTCLLCLATMFIAAYIETSHRYFYLRSDHFINVGQRSEAQRQGK